MVISRLLLVVAFIWCGTVLGAVQVRKNGKVLEVTATLESGVRTVELRLHSSRNEKISKFTDITPLQPKTMAPPRNPADREAWYPVVDVALESGIEGVAVCEPPWNALYTLNGMFYRAKLPLAGEIGAAVVADTPRLSPPPTRGKGLERRRLIDSLAATVGFTIRSQNTDPQSRTRGGLFLFYDLDAHVCRSSHWIWGWGPSVRMLLDAARTPEVARSAGSGRMRRVAGDIGSASLRFRPIEAGHPARYIPTSRWERSLRLEYGLAELYRVTRDPKYREIDRKYIEQHPAKLGRDDGLWNQNYIRSTRRSAPTGRVTRAAGWAMEGLLASHRMMPEGRYLDFAKKMAEHLLRHQHSSGYWLFAFDSPSEEIGISKKGTALWSLLFYRLYAATHDDRHLRAARKALAWLMDSQCAGPDPEAHGSVTGVTRQSAVGYRPWFRVSCTYTSAYFGLAVLEELRLVEGR